MLPASAGRVVFPFLAGVSAGGRKGGGFQRGLEKGDSTLQLSCSPGGKWEAVFCFLRLRVDVFSNPEEGDHGGAERSETAGRFPPLTELNLA